jgi:protoheme IX farnesyltransferase
MGRIYLVGAAAGGAWFLLTSWRLVREPGPRTAMINFHASLGQLSLLLFAAILDALL